MASDMNECLFLTDQKHQLLLNNVESMLVCCLTSAAGAGHFFFSPRLAVGRAACDGFEQAVL